MSSALVYTVGLVLIRGLGFISAPIFTTLLTPEDYGLTNTFATWTLLFSTVFSLYTQGSLAAAIKDYKGQDYENYVTSSITLSTLSFLVFNLCCLVNLTFFSRILGYSRFITVMLLVSSYTTFIFNYYQTKLIYEGRKNEYLLTSFLVSLTSIGISYALIKLMPADFAVDGKILGGIVPLLVATLVYMVVQYRKGKAFISLDAWKYCLALSIPAIFTTLANVLLSQIARIYLQHMSGEYEAGIYSFAFTLSEVTNFIRLGLFNAWIPWYFKHVAQGDSEGAVPRLARLSSRIFCVIVLGFIFTSPEVYKLLSPSSYWGGIPTMVYLSIGTYFSFIACFYSCRFQFFKKNRWITYVTFVSVGCNVLLNNWLIPTYASIGAAVSFAVSYVVLFLAFLVPARKNNVEDHISGKLFLPDIVLLAAGSALYFVTAQMPVIRWIIAVGLGAYLVYYGLRNKSGLLSMAGKGEAND